MYLLGNTSPILLLLCHIFTHHKVQSVFQPALMVPVTVSPASPPALGRCRIPSISCDSSAKKSVDVQQAGEDAVDHPDRPLTFSHWKFLLSLFARSNNGSKPLPFFVSASLHKIHVPHGLYGCPSSQMAPKQDLGSFGPLDIFRVAGTVVLPQTICHIQPIGRQGMPILKQEIWLSATNSVKIVSRCTGEGTDAKTLSEPPPISLNWSSYKAPDRDETRIPFMWHGLQFHVRSDNSDSCRTGLAKRFFVQLQIVASLFSGDRIIIAQVQAGPLIIQDSSTCELHGKKDIPLSGSALLCQADRDKSANATKAIPTPKLHGSVAVAPAVQSFPPPRTSSSARQQAHKIATSVSALRSRRWNPYSSTVPAHIRQQSRRAKLSTGHLLGTTTRLPITT